MKMVNRGRAEGGLGQGVESGKAKVDNELRRVEGMYKKGDG